MDIVQLGFDTFDVLRWVFINISHLFSILIKPVFSMADFLRGFFDGFSAPPPAETITWTFPSYITAFFSSIPYFNTFCFALGCGLSIMFALFIFKTISKF
jgi:hypothetical protein